MQAEQILFTGGSGLLGSEIRQRLPEAWYPTSTEFDVVNYQQMQDYLHHKDISLIIHAAAFTSPPLIDQDPARAIAVNILGTANIVQLCMLNTIRLIYISTDYVFKGDTGHYNEESLLGPVNKYAWSKLGGECAVRLYERGLIIRTSFGPNEFPYPKAFIDQWTSRESVSRIAAKIVTLADKDITGVIHIGGKRQTVYEHAKSLHPAKTIGELSIRDVPFVAPQDTSLDCSYYDKIVKSDSQH